MLPKCDDKSNLDPLSWSEMNADFKAWLEKEDLLDFNSIIVNVYLQNKDRIGWHGDKTDNMAEGTVVS